MTGAAGVVVGIDGSPRSAAALMTALEEAARRGETVTAVLAYPAPGSWGATGHAGADEPDRLATAVLEEARRFVDEATMPLPAPLREVALELSVRAGSPAPLLAEAARTAALLVVGHRGRGMVGGAVLGSTALRVLSLAACPVLVDRPRETAADGPVVVGIDRSMGSAAALRYALRDATRRGVGLVAVTGTAPPPVMVGFRPMGAATLSEVSHALQPRVEQFVAEVVDEVVNEVVDSDRRGHSAPQVDVVVRGEDPTAALVDVAEQRGAPLVVVGRTGHGAFARWLLGSVAHGAVVRAPCPVVVVPEHPHEDGP
ncbi:universal stress protein [Actinomycetospora chibensis]|uniref:Universal stress protein n=1 Tax=Actinomycetospora chibensis TaxID=663606 RepID=A0ABV9RD53_9PSEU|nr:universal stress protein [Actinomycetospora chibensis]MDD7922190.1 universal stress protein [Actinomycetospora chibensis]